MFNNFFYYPFKNVEQTDAFISENYNLIYAKPHFLNFKAYQFEFYDIEARENLDHYKLHIKVYKRCKGLLWCRPLKLDRSKETFFND